MPQHQTIATVLRTIRDFVGGLAAPNLCPVCGVELLDGEHGICLNCLMTLPRTIYGSAAPLSELLSNAIAPVGIAASWFLYDPKSDLASVIRKAKYDDRPALMRALGRQFARELAAAGESPAIRLADVDLFLPVPMHWQKRMRRGFNQSQEIALGIAAETGITIGNNLVAVAPHSTQTRRSSAGRRENMEGKFAVKSQSTLDGLNIAFVDDIVTTGATILECVRAVSRSGAHPASVGVLSLGITRR